MAFEPVYERHEPEHGQLVRNVAAAAVAVCGGFAAVFLFFAAMGAVPLGDALVATVIAVLMGLVWAASFYWRQSHGASRNQWRDRERRGF